MLTLTSSNAALVTGFEWAKAQALAYVYRGDAVGDWYEAALPGREAFCMRDVAHQSTGAQLLGLADCNYTMLRRFAENISASKDWCTYWEINRHNQPCPADYQSDAQFWYNLPANFDLLHCCYRQYLWTGDRRYLADPTFTFFYNKSVTAYVARWDRDGDGILDHLPSDGIRGIGTYNEVVPHPRVGGDLIAAQYGAYLAYAHIQEWRGEWPVAEQFLAKAEALQQLYYNTWWDEAAGRFASFRLQDGTLHAGYHGVPNFFPLYFDLIPASQQRDRALADVLQNAGPNVEERAYLPELFYHYGQHEAAFAHLMAQLAPTYERRDYPEVSFCAIGNIGAGLLGLQPDATTRTVTTQPRLTAAVEWVELAHTPVFDTLLTIRHQGNTGTTLYHQQGDPIHWRACLPGALSTLTVNGVQQPATQERNKAGQPMSSVIVSIRQGETHTVTS